MLTLLIVILSILAVVGYVHVGWRIADAALRTWLDKDNRSRTSYLLFPVSHAKGCVGEEGRNILSIMDYKGKPWDGDSGGPMLYKIGLTVLWPAKLLFNVPAILLYGGLRKVRALPPPHDALNRLVPEPDDDVSTLLGKRQAVLGEIEALAAKKRLIDDEIIRRKSEMEAVLELEADADPEVRKLLAAQKTNA